MKGLHCPGRVKRVAWGILVLLCLVVPLVLLLQPSPPPPFAILQPPFSKPSSARDRLLNAIPGASSSAWGDRLGNLLFGRRKPVNFTGTIVAFSDPSGEGLVSALGLGRPSFSEPNECQAWLLEGGKTQALLQRLAETQGVITLNRARFGTADGVEAALSISHSAPVSGVTFPVGLKVNCFPRVRKKSTDLFTTITLSEAVTNQPAATSSGLSEVVAIHTNLDLAIRIQIPINHGIFLVPARAPDSKRGTLGILIDLR